MARNFLLCSLYEERYSHLDWLLWLNLSLEDFPKQTKFTCWLFSPLEANRRSVTLLQGNWWKWAGFKVFFYLFKEFPLHMLSWFVSSVRFKTLTEASSFLLPWDLVHSRKERQYRPAPNASLVRSGSEWWRFLDVSVSCGWYQLILKSSSQQEDSPPKKANGNIGDISDDGNLDKGCSCI